LLITVAAAIVAFVAYDVLVGPAIASIATKSEGAK
jgi:hypothetical protein